MILFFYGPNSFKAKQKINELKEKFNREIDPSGQSFNFIDGQTADLKEISNLINTGSLFTKKRMTLMENIFKNKKTTIIEEFLKYLIDNNIAKSEDVLMIYEPSLKTEKEKIVKIGSEKNSALNAKEKKLFAYLQAQKFSAEFKLPTSQELIGWIKDEAKKRGGAISFGATQLLVSLVGNDLWQINNELEKLVNYKKADEINEADVKQLVKGIYSEDIFALINAFATKNKKTIFEILEREYEGGINDEYVIVMLFWQFKILAQIREELDRGTPESNIASILKIHPFVARKGIEQARRFTLEDLKNIIKNLINFDYLSKTGQGDLRTNLSLLVSRL